MAALAAETRIVHAAKRAAADVGLTSLAPIIPNRRPSMARTRSLVHVRRQAVVRVRQIDHLVHVVDDDQATGPEGLAGRSSSHRLPQ